MGSFGGINIVRLTQVVIAIAVMSVLAAAQSTPRTAKTQESKMSNTHSKPTVADAEKFIAETESTLNELNIKLARAQWIQATFITDDTETISADYNDRLIAELTRLAPEVKRFDGLKMPPVLARKFLLLKLQLFSLEDPKEREEYTKLASSLEGDYGKGKYCPKTGKFAGKCLPIGEIEKIMATSRDPEEMKEVWVGWHAIGAPMRTKYARYVELQNKGARELGFKDMGAQWRSNYDMTPEQFSADTERLWQQVRPLYESLHTYVRNQLVKQYGAQAADANGMIRADLLGNPWAQEWEIFIRW